MVFVYDSLFLKIPIMQRSFQGEVDMEFPQNLGKFVSFFILADPKVDSKYFISLVAL